MEMMQSRFHRRAPGVGFDGKTDTVRHHGCKRVMMEMEKKTCFTCATEITPYAAYCEERVEKIEANGGMTELEAFEATTPSPTRSMVR